MRRRRATLRDARRGRWRRNRRRGAERSSEGVYAPLTRPAIASDAQMAAKGSDGEKGALDALEGDGRGRSILLRWIARKLTDPGIRFDLEVWLPQDVMFYAINACDIEVNKSEAEILLEICRHVRKQYERTQ